MTETHHHDEMGEESWRVFRVIAEFVDAFETLARLGPAVSVFGSARLPSTDEYYAKAVRCGAGLVEKDFAVITGPATDGVGVGSDLGRSALAWAPAPWGGDCAGHEFASLAGSRARFKLTVVTALLVMACAPKHVSVHSP